MILAFIGPPGSGKGTYSREISRKYGLAHIEAGRLLRNEMEKDSDIGREIRPFMNAGLIPPIEITIKLVENRLKEEDAEKGAVFDGYPRNMGQAEAMERFAKPDIVINLVLPYEILVEKIMARMTCPKCGEIYNTVSVKKNIDGVKYELPALLPQKDGICDRCGSVLVKRSDQSPEIISKRLEVHEKESGPLLDYYSKKGILINVIVTEEKEKMVENISSLIKNLMPSVEK